MMQYFAFYEIKYDSYRAAAVSDDKKLSNRVIVIPLQMANRILALPNREIPCTAKDPTNLAELEARLSEYEKEVSATREKINELKT